MTATLPEAPALTLADARKRAKDLRDRLMQSGTDLTELRAKSPADRGDTWVQDVQLRAAEIVADDAALTATLSAMRGLDLAEQRAAAPKAAGAPDAPKRQRTAGQLFVESDQYRQRNARGIDPVTVPRLYEVRTLLSSETSDPAAGELLPQGQPIPPVPRQLTLRIRDLITVQQTDLASIPYVRELNPAVNELGATGVTEGSAKPEATMQFQGADAPVRKIAAWVPVTTEIVDDVTTLRGYVDTRLAYMLDRAEDDQLLNGNGTSPYIRGIRQTSGLQTQTLISTAGVSNNSADPAATIGRAIGKVELVDLEPDGVVMHPTDYWTMVSSRNGTQFDGSGDGISPFGPPERQLFGLPVIRTRAMASGKALVGAWRLAATLFDRMQTEIAVSDSHSTYFTENKLAIRAEKRVALALFRPDGFVEATIA